MRSTQKAGFDAPQALLIVVATIAVEMIRAAGPLLDRAFSAGIIQVTITALVTFAAPALFLALLAGRRVPSGRVVLLAVSSLVVVRLVLQALGAGIDNSTLATIRWFLGLAGVGLAIAALLLTATLVVGQLPFESAARARKYQLPGQLPGTRIALGIFFGAVLAAGISLLLQTWDAYWRTGINGWWPPVLLGVAALGLAWTTRNLSGTRVGVGLWVLGPFIALVIQILVNPAFIASQTGLSLTAAVVALAVAAVLAGIWLPLRPTLAHQVLIVSLTAAVAILGLGWTLLGPDRVNGPGAWGWAQLVVFALVIVLVADLASSGMGGRSAQVRPAADLATPRATPTSAALTAPAAHTTATVQRTWNLPIVGAVAGLGMVLTFLLYQLDYDVPLPLPNQVIPIVALAVIAPAAMCRASRRAARLASFTQATATPRPAAQRHGAADRRLAADHHPVVDRHRVAPAVKRPWTDGLCPSAAAMGLGLGVIALVGLLQVDVPRRPADVASVAETTKPVIRVLDWNLHYGVSTGPGVPLDEIAKVINDSGADIVTLQEVSRGWVLGGGADMATYLAHATGKRFEFAPAADRQFGNVLLIDPALSASAEAENIVRHGLPYGDGPQNRSAISATVNGVRVTSVHLQHRESNTPTRLEQLSALFQAEPVTGQYVLAGDFNAEPGWAEIDLIESQGLVSAQDAAGDPSQLTSPSDDPKYRIDWVFGNEVTADHAEVLDSEASDHRPVLVELHAGN